MYASESPADFNGTTYIGRSVWPMSLWLETWLTLAGLYLVTTSETFCVGCDEAEGVSGTAMLSALERWGESREC